DDARIGEELGEVAAQGGGGGRFRRAEVDEQHARDPRPGERRHGRGVGVRPARRGAALRRHRLVYARRPHVPSPGAASRMAVTPMPPAVQTDTRPRPLPLSARSFASVATMRAPVAANGWPIATLPPFTLSFERSIAPSGRSRPSRSRQNVSDSHAASVARVRAAEASWIT